MAENGGVNPGAPALDVWNGVDFGKVHYFVRSPWQWVMKNVASPTMEEVTDVAELPSANQPADVPPITPSTPATRRRREARKLKGPSTLKLEIVDPNTKEIVFAAHSTSAALDGLEDKDELVRTMQRCRCDKLNLSPPSVLISWDVTRDECLNVIGKEVPVLKGNNCSKKYAVLKEPMGSQGKGIFFVQDADEIHKIIDEHRQKALNEPDFLDKLISVKGRIPSWVLQAEVCPALLIEDGRKFHIRTYVLIIEKLHDEEMFDIFIFNRHEVRIAGVPVDNDAEKRDPLSHITNGALSSTTERRLLHEVEELKSRELGKKTELFVSTVFGKHLIPDIARRISLSAQQEQTRALKFAVAGLDLMVTENNRIYLLEVNANPAAPPASSVSEGFKNHLEGFMRDMVDMVAGKSSPNFLDARDILYDNGLLED